MRHAFEIPEGWSAHEGRFGDLGEDYLFLTSPGWRIDPSQEGDGDASRPSILIMRQGTPAESLREVLAGTVERARAFPGYRLVSDEPSGLPHGRIVTQAFSGPRLPLGRGGGWFASVRRSHVFVSGGRPVRVISEAGEGEWEDGNLLRLAEGIEAGVAEENG